MTIMDQVPKRFYNILMRYSNGTNEAGFTIKTYDSDTWTMNSTVVHKGLAGKY